MLMMLNYVVGWQMIFMLFIISYIFKISTMNMWYFYNIFIGGKIVFHFFLILCIFFQFLFPYFVFLKTLQDQ